MKKTLSILLATVLLLSIGTGVSIYALADSDKETNSQSENFAYIVLEDGTAEIGYAGSETTVHIPAEVDGYVVTSIGYLAFYNSQNLKSVSIPDTVTTIHASAFERCSNLESIHIPKSVVNIMGTPVRYCPNIKSITVEASNPVYDSRNNCNAIIETKSNTLISGCMNTIIPDSITQIQDSAFIGSGLTHIDIPESVITIGEEAFANSLITSIDIPESITTLSRKLFAGCHDLTSVTLSNNLQDLGESTFIDCIHLKNITIPENVTEIRGTFPGCISLESMILPENIKRVAYDAFAGCSAMESIVILNPTCEIESGNMGDMVFYDQTVIYGYNGSTAQAYSEQFDRKFVSLDENPIIPIGTDTQYQSGSEAECVIHCAYPLNNFVNVAMDDVTVDPANYTLAEGSTILTFSPAYLDTLPAGEHTVTLNYKNATATAMLTILADPNEPTTDPDPDEPATEPGEPATKPSEPITEPGTPTTPGEPTGGTPSDDDIPTSAVDSVSSTENAVKTDAATKSPDTGAQPAALTFAVLLAASVGLSALLYTQKRKRCV